METQYYTLIEKQDFFEIIENKFGELAIFIDARDGSPVNPVLEFDGKKTALLKRDERLAVRLDNIDEETKGPLAEAEFVLIVELNGMHQAADFYLKTPDTWQIAQEVMFADANTFLSYNQNMRQLTVDKLAGAELVVFNRMAPGTDVMPFHKIARAVNRRIDILYEFTDGTTKQDDIEDPLPFDLNAPVVKIEDEDYALFYRDITEEPDKYKGKTVEFKGQVAKLRREKEGMFAPGRFVMTCCEADITFMGIPCRFVGADGLKPRSWVTVRAEVEVRYHNLYHGVGPILNAISISPAEPAQQQVAAF